MSMQPSGTPPEGLASDPGLFPQRIDFLWQALLIVRHTRETLAAASFLDDRILTPQAQAQWLRFDAALGAFTGAPPQTTPLNFIFHAGHVGSTLLSRLLDEVPGVLGLREPQVLRTLAEAHDVLDTPQSLVSPALYNDVLRLTLALLRRPYPDTRAIVVKATSSAARIAPLLLGEQRKAVYLNLAREPYLATLLAGENSILDLRGHGPERIRRFAALAGVAPTPLYAMSPGELAALAWATEKLTQADLVRRCGARILSLDFDAMLHDVGGALRQVCAHFGLVAPDSYFANAAQSPVLQRYAKSPEAAYSPQLRAQVLAQARGMHTVEIAKGQRWVEALARTSPAIAALI